MPHLFTHADYTDMDYVYVFRSGNEKVSVAEYRYSYTNHTVLDCKVPSRCFNSGIFLEFIYHQSGIHFMYIPLAKRCCATAIVL